MKKALVVIFWIMCGYYNWGYTLGSFTHQFPMANHVGTAGFFAALGPVGTVSVLVAGNGHWLLKPYTTEQRWQAFHKEFPTAPREDFEQMWN